MRCLSKIIKKYPKNSAVICYRFRGKLHYWTICFNDLAGLDNEVSLRQYLKKHIPQAEFMGCAIK